MNTKIEWVKSPDGSQGFTVNPIRFRNLTTGKVGHHCTKISPGCKNCYASTMNGGPYLSGLTYIAENTPKGEFFLDENVLHKVLHRQRPATYFWCDMTDLFGEWVPDEWKNHCFATCALTPQHRHLWLTKRAKEMRQYFNTLAEGRVDDVYDVATDMAHADIRNTAYLQEQADRLIDNWPLSNLGLGVSAEDQQRAAERWEHLKATPAAMRFMSGEPLLGNITLDSEKQDGLHALGCGNEPDCGCGTVRLDWVIVGGESGPGARPMHPDWARGIRDECQAAGVPFFFKQYGEWAPECEMFHKVSEHRYSHETFAWDRNGTPYNALNPPADSFPSQMVYRVGTKSAGRLLDGRMWDELPKFLSSFSHPIGGGE